MNCFEYQKDAEHIVTLTINMPGPVNIINQQFSTDFLASVERLESERDSIVGVILTSASTTFIAGADLKKFVQFNKSDVPDFYAMVKIFKEAQRRLEQLGRPVVCALNGSALGGGFEVALACHHRIAINDASSRFGLPEAALGILPGGGGMTRTMHMLGAESALPLLLEGKKLRPQQAYEAKLIDEIATDASDMITKAKSWIKNNPNAQQPWEKLPKIGDINSLKLLMIAPAMMLKKTRGAYPVSKEILNVAKEILTVEFDTAVNIETRALAKMLLTAEAHNMINTFFFELNALNAGESRPKDIPKQHVSKIGILGAGMMGRGIAYVCALAKIDVVLLDSTLATAEQGKAYSEKLLAEHPKKSDILNRIKPTEKISDLQGCDLIIEAVFENVEVKAKITREAEPMLKMDDGLFASNTSTLPISLLAKASNNPANFIGIHFFSPVEKMQLIEIIVGKETSDWALAKAFDFAQQIKKIPIVVNDSRGFFTSRVFSTYIDEGIRLLDEGIHPARIENLARMTGMPVGPLAVTDEVSQRLTVAIADQNSISYRVAKQLIDEFNRGGRAYGGGFYEYPENAQKHLWPKLLELYFKPNIIISDHDIQERLLFRQVIEALRCYEEGILNSVIDANIGSIFGIGFPPQTGGVLQFIKAYGKNAFIERATELSKLYGDRFEPPELNRSFEK